MSGHLRLEMEAEDRSKPFSCDSLVHRQPIQFDVMVTLNKLSFPSKCVAKHSIASGFYLVGRTNALRTEALVYRTALGEPARHVLSVAACIYL